MTDPLSYSLDDAFHGPLGEYARLSEPHLETDYFSFYGQLLVMIGVLIGRRAKCWGGDSEHYANLFALVIAETGRGKGCASNRAERFATAVDPSLPSKLHRDVQSGPALINLVTDERVRAKPQRGKNASSAPVWEIAVPAVKDKRCLIIQQEMQIIFTAKGRSGDTLGPVLRLAWDGLTLQHNTKNDSVRATNPHIGLIGSITPAELHGAMASSKLDLVNGFHNRFLWLVTEHVRDLPHGSDRTIPEHLVTRVRSALANLGSDFSVTAAPREYEFDAEAKAGWESFYLACRSSHPLLDGLENFATRLPPLTKRVAMILAVLDGDTEIRLSHLRAAKAFTIHCLALARPLITGRNSAALPRGIDRNLERLRQRALEQVDWFTRTDAWQWANRRGVIDEPIQQLVATGEWEARQTEVNGRQVVQYRVTVADEATAEIKADEHQGEGDLRHGDYLFSLGQQFTVPRDVDALTVLDRPTHLKGGAIAYLTQSPTAAGADTTALDKLSQRKRNHRLVYSDGSLFLLPLKLATEWADAATEEPDAELSWDKDAPLLLAAR